MTIWVENPFTGFQVGWTWAQHVAAGYEGGTDYIFYPTDGSITAAADGTVRLAPGENGFTPGDAIILTLTDGRTINYREVASHTGSFPRTVQRGDAVGEPTDGGRWPHIDATVGGKRVPFEPLVNIGTAPAGDGVQPIGEDMFVHITAGAFLFRDAGQWVTLTQAQATLVANVVGSPVTVSASDGAALVAAFPNKSGVDPVALGNAIASNAQFLAAVSGAGLTNAELASALTSALSDIPTSAQLGQALTSAVSLMDSHVDAAFAGLTLKTS